MGQVYIPSANWLLCAVVIAAVIGFGSSSRLAGAYGVAVTATMLVDTLLTFFVIRYGWGYPLALCILATGFFALVDLAFFSSTLLKIADGGWFPLVIGAGVYLTMATWWRVRVRYGFMNRPDVTSALELCGALGLQLEPMETSFFLSRQKIVPTEGGAGMALWRDRVF